MSWHYYGLHYSQYSQSLPSITQSPLSAQNIIIIILKLIYTVQSREKIQQFSNDHIKI